MKTLLTALGLTAALATTAVAEEGSIRVHGSTNTDNIGLGGVEVTVGRLLDIELNVGGSGLINSTGVDDVLFDFKIGKAYGEKFQAIPELGYSISVAHPSTGGNTNINFGGRAEYSGIEKFKFGMSLRYHVLTQNDDLDGFFALGAYVRLK